jgi:hypothetical protein
MSNYVNKALLDASPYRKQKEESAKLVGKWEKTGLLDGLNEDFAKSGMAQLLENQAKQLVSVVSTTSPSGLGTGSDEEWSGVALPLVRRVFGEIVAQDLVSVQPMNLPSGLVFYLDFKYGSSRTRYNDTTTGVANGGEGNVTSLGGKTGPHSPGGGDVNSSAPFGVGGLYGEGRYDYSINGALSDELTIGAAADDDTYATGSVTYKDVNFNQEFSSSLSSFKKVEVATGDLSNLDKKAVRSFNISGSSGFTVTDMAALNVLPQFTSIDEVNSTLSFIVSGSVTDFVAALKHKVSYRS